MFNEFANDQLVRLLTPNEEKTMLENRIKELMVTELELSMEHAKQIASIRAERSKLIQKLEEGKWND